MKIEIVKATRELIDQMKGRFRKEDDIECIRACGKDAYQCSVDGLRDSLACWVGLKAGVPFCAYGVCTISETALSRSGSPWLLGTEEFRTLDVEEKRFVILESQEKLRRYLQVYDRLENYVDASNKVAVSYLKRLGFNFDDAKPYGKEGHLFYRFFLTRR